MILADLGDFVHWWWYPILLVYVLVAFYVGGRVLHKSLAAQAARGVQPAKHKITVGRCCLAVFLAVVAAGVTGWAIKYLVGAIGSAYEMPFSWWAPIAFGAIAAIPAFLLVIVAMFNMPLGQLLPGTGKALGVVIVITAVCGTAIGVPANKERIIHIEQMSAADHLHKIFGYLQEVTSRFTKAMPGDLAALKKIDKFDPQLLKCPRQPDKEIGFFYCSPGAEAMLKANPPPSRTAGEVVTSQGGEGIIACEFKDSRRDGRVILMRNGNVQWVEENEFQRLLNNKINEDFRKELDKVEK